MRRILYAACDTTFDAQLVSYCVDTLGNGFAHAGVAIPVASNLGQRRSAAAVGLALVQQEFLLLRLIRGEFHAGNRPVEHHDTAGAARPAGTAGTRWYAFAICVDFPLRTVGSAVRIT